MPWIATDANGDVYEYDEIPEIVGDEWVVMEGEARFVENKPHHDWKFSLDFAFSER